MSEVTQALEELYRRRYTHFRNGLAALTHSYDAARDAVQETFARALRAEGTFRGEGSLEAWVWRIALRTAYEYRPNALEAPLEDWFEPALPEPERDPALANALRRLPPRKRTIVFLRYFADLPQSDIAAVCGISRGTVAASLAQARATLMIELEGARTGT
jgi:RNA polymerase sigma factor (sigma-70 family)